VSLSVILPVLDEAAHVEAAVGHLCALSPSPEIVVVDGGSTDGTPALARAAGADAVLAAPRGRARQMNAGAAAAAGEVLCFLHADVRLPAGAPRLIDAALADPAAPGGAFRTWHVPEGPWPRPLAPLLHLADLRSRYARLPYGDQALFVRRAAFEAVGGFPDIPLMEDLAFSRRLRRLGPLARVPASVTVSARRFQQGPVRYTVLVNTFPVLYYLGVPPAALARLYHHVR
jgi:rSAM/selenodomain-associated transferase 2